MKFWDSSAVVALLVEDGNYARALAALKEDPAIVVWWSTQVECAGALIRREREGRLSDEPSRLAWSRLRGLIAEWQEVLPSPSVRVIAERMLRVHPLRAVDALQLAAALIAAEDDPSHLDLVCFDDRLTNCAAREGFRTR